MENPDTVFHNLSKSTFRQKFTLKAKEKSYLENKGFDTIVSHAEDFIRSRLAPGHIPNDGKQTPMKNHPVFVAQHATATCCRGCMAKWHKIPTGRPLTEEEIQYIKSIITKWLEEGLPSPESS